MPSSVSWQRYDEEYNVSSFMTEAARACVAAHPTDVRDYFSRYFREVAGGTSVRLIRYAEVLSVAGGAAVAFTLELSAGPESSVTTSDLTGEAVTATAAATATVSQVAGKSLSASPVVDDGATGDGHSAAVHAACSTVVARLQQLGYVEPQQDWDAALAAALADTTLPAAGVLAMQWALSLMAALVASKQRGVPLYRAVTVLMEQSRTGRPAHGLAATGTGRTAMATGVAGGIDSTASRPFAVPPLLVTFLVSAAGVDAADTSGNVRFSHVYVGLDVLPAAQEDPYDVGYRPAPVDGATLRLRMRKVVRAAHRFLQSHSSAARVGADGVLRWDGAANLADIVKAVSDALSSVQLRVGVEVSLGLCMGASTTRLTAAEVAEAGIKEGPGERAIYYSLFGGEPPVTGDQLSEYVKEQVEEMGFNALQFLEDTHVAEDRVARQRLQMALQDTVVLCDVMPPPTVEDASTPVLAGSEGAFPHAVVDPCACGTLHGAVELLATANEAARRGVVVVVGPVAGSAETAAHVADVAIACGASYVQVNAGVFSSRLAAVASQLAARQDELIATHLLADRSSPLRFNRREWPPLPAGDVAPIRRKGDKKKKDAGKAGGKKK